MTMKLILLLSILLLAIEQIAARLTAHIHFEKPSKGNLYHIMVKPQPTQACDGSSPDRDGVGDTDESSCCDAPSQCGDGTCNIKEKDDHNRGQLVHDSSTLQMRFTSPNCPPEATSCLCPDRSTSCSNDQDCPVETSTSPGTCSGGLRSGLPCTEDVFCPTENGYTDCVGVESVVALPEEGSCRACSGVLQHSGLIIGDINQCGEGDLCGDYTNSTNPVTCISCLSPMTCEDWCMLDNNLGQYEGQFLESYTARTSCPGGGFDSSSCSISSFMSDSWTTASNTHAGALCDAHNFGACGDSKDWCANEFPHDTYCQSLGTISISGTLDTKGVCTCHATVGTTTKEVWSSECIENLYMYDHGPFGNGNGTQPAVALPCSFTG